MLIPDVKIRAAQQNTTNKVWPISGWATKSTEITDIKIIDIKYLNKIFDLISHKIVAKIITKNGFRTSMGWNLGKKNKSIHLWALLTSTPIIGTKNSEIKENKKKIGEILNNLFSLMEDNKKIIIRPKITKDKCLKKKV